jgi:ribosomal protein S27AE
MTPYATGAVVIYTQPNRREWIATVIGPASVGRRRRPGYRIKVDAGYRFRTVSPEALTPAEEICPSCLTGKHVTILGIERDRRVWMCGRCGATFTRRK